MLLCLTYAGGKKNFYDNIESCLSPDIEVIKYDYSGHGERIKEPFLDTIGETALDIYRKFLAEYAAEINDYAVSYSIMGYSMGSIVTLELVKLIIEKKELRLPEHVFISAHEPKIKIIFSQITGEQLDEYVKKRTIEFGGVPESLIDNKSFWRIYLPLYKADYLMIARYRFEDININTQIPATVFYSEEDTKFEDMKHWRDYFNNSCEFIEYTGQHFFINTYYKEMAEIIKDRME